MIMTERPTAINNTPHAVISSLSNVVRINHDVSLTRDEPSNQVDYNESLLKKPVLVRTIRQSYWEGGATFLDRAENANIHEHIVHSHDLWTFVLSRYKNGYYIENTIYNDVSKHRCWHSSRLDKLEMMIYAEEKPPNMLEYPNMSHHPTGWQVRLRKSVSKIGNAELRQEWEKYTQQLLDAQIITAPAL